MCMIIAVSDGPTLLMRGALGLLCCPCQASQLYVAAGQKPQNCHTFDRLHAELRVRLHSNTRDQCGFYKALSDFIR